VRLIPRDEGFFDLFDGLAVRMTRSSTLLNLLFTEPVRLEQYAGQIKELEHQADEITHEIMVRLDRSFVTPLDREDIHTLATCLDTVVDLIDGTARRAQMFHLADRREPAKELTRVLQEATEQIAIAVSNLKKPAEVAAIGRLIKNLEEEGEHHRRRRGRLGQDLGNVVWQRNRTRSGFRQCRKSRGFGRASVLDPFGVTEICPRWNPDMV